MKLSKEKTIFFSSIIDFLFFPVWKESNLKICFLNDKLNSSMIVKLLLFNRFKKINQILGEFNIKNVNAYIFCRKKSCSLAFKMTKKLLFNDVKKSLLGRTHPLLPMRIEIAKILASLIENVLKKIIFVDKLNFPEKTLFLTKEEFAIYSLIRNDLKSISLPRIEIKNKFLSFRFKNFFFIKKYFGFIKQIIFCLDIPNSKRICDNINIEVANCFFKNNVIKKYEIYSKSKTPTQLYLNKNNIFSNFKNLWDKKILLALSKDLKIHFAINKCPVLKKNPDTNFIFDSLLLRLPLVNFWTTFLKIKKVKSFITFEPNSFLNTIIAFRGGHLKIETREYQYSFKNFASPFMSSCNETKVIVDPIFKKIYNPFFNDACKFNYKNNLFSLRKNESIKIQKLSDLKWIVYFDETIESSMFGLNNLTEHLNEIKKILDFLHSNKDYGLLLKPQFKKNSILCYLENNESYMDLNREKRLIELVRGTNRNSITPFSVSHIGYVFVGKMYGGSAAYEAATHRKKLALINDKKTITPWQCELKKAHCIYKNIDHFLFDLQHEKVCSLKKPIFQYL